MLKIQRTANGEVVSVIGQLQTDNVGELSSQFPLRREARCRALALDLKDLVLVDDQAVRFLRACESQGIELRNCPEYVRLWISLGKAPQ